MNLLRSSRRVALVIAVLVGATSIHFATHACSPGVSFELTAGPLGFHPWWTLPSNVVPQNVAVLSPEAFGSGDAGVAVIWDAVPDHRWSVPSAPFTSGTSLTFGTRTAQVGTYIDSVAPTVPTLVSATIHSGGSSRVGCGEGRCGYSSSFELRIVPSTDDHALPSQITYEIHAGITAVAAQSSTMAVALLVASDDSLATLGDLGSNAGYVAVVAVDQAGNVSARTESVRVRR